jgi:hypothetical protein
MSARKEKARRQTGAVVSIAARRAEQEFDRLVQARLEELEMTAFARARRARVLRMAWLFVVSAAAFIGLTWWVLG